MDTGSDGSKQGQKVLLQQGSQFEPKFSVARQAEKQDGAQCKEYPEDTGLKHPLPTFTTERKDTHMYWTPDTDFNPASSLWLWRPKTELFCAYLKHKYFMPTTKYTQGYFRRSVFHVHDLKKNCKSVCQPLHGLFEVRPHRCISRSSPVLEWRSAFCSLAALHLYSRPLRSPGSTRRSGRLAPGSADYLKTHDLPYGWQEPN